MVRIGNSQGLRIPKAILQACGIHDQVELSIDEGRLIVQPARRTREGWAEAAQAMAQHGDDSMLDPETQTEFDTSSWEW